MTFYAGFSPPNVDCFHYITHCRKSQGFYGYFSPLLIPYFGYGYLLKVVDFFGFYCVLAVFWQEKAPAGCWGLLLGVSDAIVDSIAASRGVEKCFDENLRRVLVVENLICELADFFIGELLF